MASCPELSTHLLVNLIDINANNLPKLTGKFSWCPTDVKERNNYIINRIRRIAEKFH